MKDWLHKLTKRQNIVKALMMLFDAIAVNMAYYLALVLRYYVRFQFDPDSVRFLEGFWQFAPYYTVLTIAVFYVFRLYNTMWRFGGLQDLIRILMACIVTSIIQVAGTLLFFTRMSLSYYVLGFIIQFCLIAGGRFAYRLYLMEHSYIENQRNAKTNAMIIGIGPIGQFARKQIEEDTTMKVVCLVSNSEEAAHQYINGVPVVNGLDDLESIIKEK